MDTFAERVRAEHAEKESEKSDHSYVRLQQAMIAKNKKVNELTNEIENLRDQLLRVKAERDRLIQISNDLRADLNRSQRLNNELMTKLTTTSAPQVHFDQRHRNDFPIGRSQEMTTNN